MTSRILDRPNSSLSSFAIRQRYLRSATASRSGRFICQPRDRRDERMQRRREYPSMSGRENLKNGFMASPPLITFISWWIVHGSMVGSEPAPGDQEEKAV